MAVGLEGNSFFFEEFALPLPTGSRATLDVDDSVARQLGGFRRVAKRSPHHSGMARPTCQSGDEAVSHHVARRYLRHDAQHRITKRTRLFSRHLIETITHIKGEKVKNKKVKKKG